MPPQRRRHASPGMATTTGAAPASPRTPAQINKNKMSPRRSWSKNNKSPPLVPSPRQQQQFGSPSHHSASKRPPKAWWEYEEQLARLAYDLKTEAANARSLHTRDLGILLQQQLVLRGRVDELLSVEGGGSATNGDRLATAVAATAQEATELQLTC